DSSYAARNGPLEFWASALVLFGLSLSFLGSACVLLPRNWQERRATPERTRRLDPFNLLIALAKRIGRRLPRMKVLESNPFYWLTSRDKLSSRMTWMAIGFLTVLWSCFFFAAVHGWRSREAFILCLLTAYVQHQVLKYA